jgi:hypothetical protein
MTRNGSVEVGAANNEPNVETLGQQAAGFLTAVTLG